jgi:hypothetical protein
MSERCTLYFLYIPLPSPPPSALSLWSVKLLHNPARPDYSLLAKLGIFQLYTDSSLFPLGEDPFFRTLWLSTAFIDSGPRTSLSFPRFLTFK